MLYSLLFHLILPVINNYGFTIVSYYSVGIMSSGSKGMACVYRYGILVIFLSWGVLSYCSIVYYRGFFGNMLY